MSEIQQNIGAWIGSIVVGSGTSLAVAWWALRGRLQEIFQTKEDSRKLVGHVEEEFRTIDRTMEGLDRRVQENATKAQKTEGRVDVLTERVQGQNDRLSEMHTALGRVDGKIDRMAQEQASNSEALKGLGHSLDALRGELRGGR